MMKKFLLVLPLFLITSGMSYAVELPSVMKQTMAQDPIGMPGMVNLVLSMVIVIALIYATGWIYTKLNIINKDKLKKITSSQNDKERFSVLQSMPLGQQRHIYSIEMNGKILLIGSTPSHINLIKEFDKNEIVNEIPVEQVSSKPEENKQKLKSSLNLDEIYRKYKS